jgi:H+/Cl- antiporter ClcA
MTFDDSYQAWPRSTPGRATVAGLGAGALGGAAVGFLSLLGDKGFHLPGALLTGGLFGCLVGAVAGGLAGAVAGGVAGLLARAGHGPARVALAFVCGVLVAVAAWFTWDPEGWAGRVVASVVVGAIAAATAWALAPWCLAPAVEEPEAEIR